MNNECQYIMRITSHTTDDIVSPVCLEHLEAIDIKKPENSHALWTDFVTCRQRNVDVLHNPHEQTIIDAFSQGVSGIDGLFTSQRTWYLQTWQTDRQTDESLCSIQWSQFYQQTHSWFALSMEAFWTLSDVCILSYHPACRKTFQAIQSNY